MNEFYKSLYPDNWPEISAKVIAEAGYKCQRCGQAPDPFFCVLTVHHWDHNPANNDPANLVCHCQGSHLYQERASIKMFGALKNEFMALLAGQLWLPGFERPGSKTGRLARSNRAAARTPGISRHAPRDTEPAISQAG